MNKQNIELDELLKEQLSDKYLLSPSESFTADTMKKIELLAEQEKHLQYEPLISKKGWLFIAGVFWGILLISMFSTTRIPIPQKIQFTKIAEIFAHGFNELSFSPALAWGIAALSFLFMLISVFYAKQYQPQK